MREKTSRKFLILAVILSTIVVAVFCAALFLSNKNTAKGNISDEISQILQTKDAVNSAVSQNNLSGYSGKIDTISENLDKINASGALKDEEARGKFEEVKNSFVKLKETGELAKVIAKISDGINDETITGLKANEKLKDVGEVLEEYESKLKEFKTKYVGNGDEMQAVLDYSELEKLGDDLKLSIEKLELSEVSSEEIESFYAKIDELRDIIAK